MSTFKTAVVTAQQMRVVYGEAWRQFEALWPAYLAKAEAEDKPVRDRYEAERAELLKRQEEESAAYEKAVQQYLKDIEEWQKKLDERERKFLGWWFYKVPPRPWYPDAPTRGNLIRFQGLVRLSADLDENVNMANALRDEASAAATLAFSGPTEFHMTQDQLQRMKDWESGAVLDTVRKYISDEKEVSA